MRASPAGLEPLRSGFVYLTIRFCAALQRFCLACGQGFKPLRSDTKQRSQAAQNPTNGRHNLFSHPMRKKFTFFLKHPNPPPIPFTRGNFNQAKHNADPFLQLGDTTLVKPSFRLKLREHATWLYM
ncbi:hypothetical protein LG288_03120 [Idiomarina seosinensis]|uniref:hypothetical protein n=1 Tax=Idiomarina seosinensis TaxID=281739 RepID=UPI00384C830B